MVSIEKHKLDGSGRRWSSTLDWVDGAGHWLYCPAGTRVTSLDDAPLPPHTTAGIQLIVPGTWWTAWWWDEPRWIGIDVAEPLRMEGSGRYGYRDLELDLWWRDGECGIVDQDELQVSLERGLLSPQQASLACTLAEDLLSRLQTGAPLFTTVGFLHLDEALRGIDVRNASSSPNGV